MKKLAIENWCGIDVIPIVMNKNDNHCRYCHFNDNDDYDRNCGVITCAPYEREDELDVYFIRADTGISPFPNTYIDTDKRTLENSACAIIHSLSGLVLTTTRRNSEILCLPGGKTETNENESTLDTIVREVSEETGLYLRKELFTPIYSEIVVGDDKRDFYCVTYVYKPAMNQSLFDDMWSIEAGIKVSFQSWDKLLTTGAFSKYNVKAEENFRNWQAAQ
jgi:8-oxo-dGTP pyrophosphatase MutT (NUDIX family)